MRRPADTLNGICKCHVEFIWNCAHTAVLYSKGALLVRSVHQANQNEFRMLPLYSGLLPSAGRPTLPLCSWALKPQYLIRSAYLGPYLFVESQKETRTYRVTGFCSVRGRAQNPGGGRAGGIFAPAAAFAASPRRAEPSSAQATQAQQPVLPLVPVLENVKGISADEGHDAEGPRRGNFYSYREERKVPLDAPRSLWSTAPAIAWGVRRNKDLVASRSRERQQRCRET